MRECHDHKFDPFTSRDFYRFAAFFADIKERGLYAGAFADGNWGPKIDLTDDELPALLQPIDDRLAALKETTDTPTPELEAAQAEWEQELLSGRTDWQILHPTAVTATAGTQFTVLEDQSILASGPLGEVNTYRVTVESVPAGITGFRVEVLPHESLPGNGPGRAASGAFVLTELTVTGQANEGPAQAIGLQNAIADFEQTQLGEINPYKKWAAASVIDKDVKGKTWGWTVGPQFGRSHDLIVETTGTGNADSLTFQLDQNLELAPNFNLGCFRLWATTVPHPLKLDPVMTLPTGQRNALNTAAADRTDEQRSTLATYYRSIAPACSLSVTRSLNCNSSENYWKQITRVRHSSPLPWNLARYEFFREATGWTKAVTLCSRAFPHFFRRSNETDERPDWISRSG